MEETKTKTNAFIWPNAYNKEYFDLNSSNQSYHDYIMLAVVD